MLCSVGSVWGSVWCYVLCGVVLISVCMCWFVFSNCVVNSYSSGLLFVSMVLVDGVRFDVFSSVCVVLMFIMLGNV